MTNLNKVFLRFDNFELKNQEFTVASKFDIGFLRDKISNLPMGTKSGRLPGMSNGFRFSQVVESIIYYLERGPVTENREKLVFQHVNIENDQPYIIAIAIQYTPLDWTDWDHKARPVTNKKSVFELLNSRYMEDLQKGKAILMLDQSVEGYHQSWLWEWFHKKCYQYKINPNCIIYTTGDQLCADSYEQWCEVHQPAHKLKVVPSVSLSIFIHKHIFRYHLKFNFDELLKYKKENLEKIFLYDCLNRRPRVQRIFNFLHLLNSGLVDDGNITMSSPNNWSEWCDYTNLDTLDKNGFPRVINPFTKNFVHHPILFKLQKPGLFPKVAKFNYEHELEHYFSYVERVCDDLYKHSWLSLVVESSYYQEEANIFISEKTFKPIAAMQPFIIVGSQHVLKYLRKLGYKTFHPFIDESYDDMPDHLRYQGIIESLKKVKAIEDKAAWYESIREIVEHNYRLFMDIGKVRAKEHEEIINYYFEYCKNYNHRE